MRLGRPKVALILTDDERVRLDSLAYRSRTAPHLARRARIILACDEGHDNTVVAKRLRMSQTTVCKWRPRFMHDRLDGLYDEPRPGAPRRITDDQIEQVIVRTLEETPRGATHWSTRGMAKASGLGRTTIAEIWRAFRLQPHRTDTFKLSKDPLLIEKIRDIVGLYMNPPGSPWSFVWTRRRRFKRSTVRSLSCRCGPAKWSGERTTYKRHGTTTLFAALNIKTAKLVTAFHRRHRSIEFRQCLDAVDAAVPKKLDVHLIMDNYGTHKTALIRNWLAKRPRFHVHFHPDLWVLVESRRALVR